MRITKLLPYLFFMFFAFVSCKNTTDKSQQKTDTLQTNQIKNQDNKLKFIAEFKMNIPEIAISGTVIEMSLNSKEKITPDSIVLFLDQKRLLLVEKINDNFSINSDDFSVGSHILKLKVFKDKKEKAFFQKFKLLSNIIPKNKTYKVVNSFYHDPNAYTQGLCIDEGVLYEATGLETKSSLRKVDILSGDVKYSISIPNNFFGEGITVFGNNIYQVTWRDHTGFIYEKDNFQQIAEFNYSTEGWGLTNNDKYLFLSDGTNLIYVLDPLTLSLIRTIEVYDHKGPIYYLNELEFIDGLIYANVYTKDYIVTIDPESGKVISKIDFKNILPEGLRTQNTDVLNGIAYDKDTKKIYITGKNWPKLFEVKIIDK